MSTIKRKYCEGDDLPSEDEILFNKLNSKHYVKKPRTEIILIPDSDNDGLPEIILISDLDDDEQPEIILISNSDDDELPSLETVLLNITTFTEQKINKK